MMEIVFIDVVTEKVKYAVTDVTLIRYITASEIGFYSQGRSRSASFPLTEKVEVRHLTKQTPHDGLLAVKYTDEDNKTHVLPPDRIAFIYETDGM